MSLLRGLFILGTIVVLVCSIVVSFNHTLTLFMEGGYKHGLEWGITIAAETSFLMGVLSRFSSRLRGTKPHGSATFLFLLGLGVVGWSNWNAGAAYGWQGIIKGILVPLFIYGAEAVLAHEFMEWYKRKQKSSDSVNEKQTVSNESVNGNIISENVSSIVSSKTVNEIVSGKIISKETVNEKTVSDNIVSEKPVSKIVNGTVSRQTVSSTNSGLKGNVIVKEIISDTVNEQNVSDSISANVSLTGNEIVSSKTVSEIVSNGSVSDQNVSSEIISGQNVSEQNVSEKTVNEIVNESVSDNQLTKHPNVVELANHPKKQTNRKRRATPEEIARVKEIALRVKQETGDLPGRPTLVEKAGCSHHLAKMVLDELKQSS